jgi:hypothetical protein
MNRPTDNERLFADALAEASPADFRNRLLGDTLRLARRRQHVRHARHTAIALGIVTALTLWLWPRPTVRHQSNGTATASYHLIETQPLPPAAIVTTQPFTSSIVASTPTLSVITTAKAHDNLHLLTDDELLSLAPAPAILVRLGPHSAELILADQGKSNVE